ncbi:MAG: NADH-quinone oxidoreductase subunit N, partial [Bdellovibrionales bacterium]
LSGIAFKISAVPFHMWTPDVYEGAPMPVTAFFALVPKLAAIGMLLRLLVVPFEALVNDWQMLVMFLSVMSMIWAAFAGLVQKNIKRLMAYSSIGNMGYALLGIAMVTTEGVNAGLFYLILYMVMTAGIFGALLCMNRDGVTLRSIQDLAGLSRNNPVLAYALAILMLSVSGIPPLSGFFGKLLVFQEVVAQGAYGLAVIGVVTSVIAAYYYLRIIKVMFFDEADAPYDKGFGPLRSLVILCSVVFAVFYILKPDLLVPYTRGMASDLIGQGIDRPTSPIVQTDDTVLNSVKNIVQDAVKLDD